jgi:hypothetical protein
MEETLPHPIRGPAWRLGGGGANGSAHAQPHPHAGLGSGEHWCRGLARMGRRHDHVEQYPLRKDDRCGQPDRFVVIAGIA